MYASVTADVYRNPPPPLKLEEEGPEGTQSQVLRLTCNITVTKKHTADYSSMPFNVHLKFQEESTNVSVLLKLSVLLKIRNKNGIYIIMEKQPETHSTV